MKYVVIFKAKIYEIDNEYVAIANKLRNKALSVFNCQNFEALCENQSEIALSYWNTLEDIQAWYLDAEHQVAQQLGKEKWYRHFTVEVCEIQRTYRHMVTNK